MKRLTIRINDRVILAVEKQPGGEPLHSRIRDLQRAAIERLGKYEDTGLTPKEISDIAAREDNIQEVNDRMEERCKTLEKCVELLRALRTYPQIKLAHAVIDDLLEEIERTTAKPVASAELAEGGESAGEYGDNPTFPSFELSEA